MKTYQNHIIRSYQSSEGILDWIEEEEDFSPSNYLYFDNTEFKSIEDFIKSFNKKYSYTIIKLNDESDLIEITFQDSEISIRVPPKQTPVNIKRNYVFITTKKKDKIKKLNQAVGTIHQLKFEMSVI